MSERITEFYVPGHSYVTRGECLRALIAAIYDTARALPFFTTDDVFQHVKDYNVEQLRRAIAPSKLVAVALNKARKNGMCVPTVGDVAPGDQLCNRRMKRLWVSKIAAPTYTA